MSDNDTLTWSDIANLYDQHRGGRAARTLPMEYVAKSLVRDGVLKVTKDGSYVIRKRCERLAHDHTLRRLDFALNAARKQT